MIAGKPPFNGENHIDLLRNIQRKAVRLPPDVKVSKECVNLLRILLNRNPLARAGFKEFMEASEAFVALGCEGQPLDATAAENQPSIRMDLGTIHETDQAARNAGSMATIATHQHIPTQKAPAQHHQLTAPPTRGPALVQPSFTTPPLGPATPPPNLVSPNDMRLSNARPTQMQPINSHLAPLQPSPPQFAPQRMNMRVENAPVMPPFDINALQRQRSITLATLPQSDPKSGQSSQHSSDGDSGFVMVERQKGDSPGSSGSYPQPSANSSSLIPSALSRARNSAPQSSNFLKASGRPRADYMMGSDGRSRSSARGMLSTSPGTGGALVGMFGLGRQRVIQNPGGNKVSVDTHIDNATKVVAAAEDVGRRAISVAHLGDNRACIAMRLVATMGTSSLLSAAPMEGVEEEDEDDEHSSANVTNDGSSDSTPVARRGRTVSLTDKSMTEAKDEVEEEEMPFALASESPANVPFAPLPSRNSSSDLKKSTLSTSKASAPPVKPTPELIRSRFGEALSCYLKALSMVKGVLAAVQKVKRDIDLTLAPSPLSGDQVKRINALAKRCEFTQNWLSGQFAGVLERADAANEEIGKLPSTAENRTAAQMGVKELIYNQALACGRDGAVKQLLGQYEASRSCYRSAGLLAETLLMENVGADDRKVLESYVDGFSTRITELDEILMEQSRSIASGGSTASGNRFAKRGSGSGVIGLIGGIQPPFLAYEPAVPPPV